jgi:hypothetical protein
MKRFIIFLLLISTAVSARVLIWDNDTGATFTDPDDGTTARGSQYSVIQTLQNNGFSGEIDVFTYLPLDISAYNAVFVLAGWWPTSGSISVSQRDRLMNYMDSGGPLYIEGGEVGNTYAFTPFYNYLGVEYVDDGRPKAEGNVNEALGTNSLDGIDLEYAPYMSENPDNFIDELREDGVNAEMVMVSKRSGNQSNGRVVWYANTTFDSYRVVYSSIIFGGFRDGTSDNKDQLMGQYIAFLKIGSDPYSGIESASLGEIKAAFK